MSGTIYQYRVECPGRRAVKVKGANRVCYGIPSKPPATIEWE